MEQIQFRGAILNTWLLISCENFMGVQTSSDMIYLWLYKGVPLYSKALPVVLLWIIPKWHGSREHAL